MRGDVAADGDEARIVAAPRQTMHAHLEDEGPFRRRPGRLGLHPQGGDDGGVGRGGVADRLEESRPVGDEDAVEEAAAFQRGGVGGEQPYGGAIGAGDAAGAVVPGDEIVDRLEGRALARLAGLHRLGEEAGEAALVHERRDPVPTA